VKKDELINKLNEDLASEFGAIIQYLTYAARATGPYRPQLSQFFLTEVADEQLHAQYLANKIVALGGEPTTVPRAVPTPETNRGMLQAVLEAERQATQSYTERAKEAEEFGDKGLVVQLEDFIRDESNHVDETERMLRNWSV
jgi:bacterioferritin